MTPNPAPRSLLSRYALPALALPAIHVTLAPWTATVSARLWGAASGHWAQWKSARHIAELRSRAAEKPEEFTTCARALRDQLAERGIKLIVLVRPDREEVLAPTGQAQMECRDLGTATLRAIDALRMAKVRVIDALSPLHFHATLHPTAPPPDDDRHLSDEMSGEIGELIVSALSDQTVKQKGRHVLFAGDCYALRVADQLRSRSKLESVRVIWRNAGSERMPYEIVSMPDSELDGVKHLVWLVGGSCLSAKNGERSFPPLATALAQRGKSQPGDRTLKVTLSKASSIPNSLGAGSPYPDALVAHEFRTDEGETILGLIEVMTGHKLVEAVRGWGIGTRLLVTLTPWETAKTGDPRLAHIQIIDDSGDFTHSRWQIVGWLHAP